MPKGSFNAAKTHCAHGHEYSSENTRLDAQGNRHCRQCQRDWDNVISIDKARARQERGVLLNHEKTHCPRGHSYDDANTYRTLAGTRRCKSCDTQVHIARDDADPRRMMWNSAKGRAKRKGVPFTITPEDIVIPPCCPVLGIPLERKSCRAAGNSPTLDRIVPSAGYVPGNIAVISFRANRIKNDASLEELERVAMWLRATLKERN